ncbi:hypothetical protein Mapa_003512 [Marchantia paleacea]|nr:hypothetical protein Mapa_003512 [Marchantia paleacea]
MTAVVGTYNTLSQLEGSSLSSPCADTTLAPQAVLDIVNSLQHGGLEHMQQIEEKFRASEEYHPTLRHDSLADIPVIDLSRAAAVAEAVSKQVGDAACDWGIFQIVNHGISVDTLQEIESQGRKFFQLPTERKLRCGRIYDPVGADDPNNSLHWAEMILLRAGPVGKIGIKSLDDVFSLMWPEGNDQLRHAFEIYDSGVMSINQRILRLFAQYFKLKEDFFSQHFKEDDSSSYTMRWNYYPRFPKPSEVLGANDHTDPFFLTVLMQDKVGGLQVRKDGQWYGVRPIEGALVVNIGDCLHAWTNGRFKSVYHRAVVNAQVDRISLVTFVYPKMEAPISAAEELVNQGHPRVYKPFPYGEFWAKSVQGKLDKREQRTAVNDGLRILDDFRIRD